jgi:hypothetical protein
MKEEFNDSFQTETDPSDRAASFLPATLPGPETCARKLAARPLPAHDPGKTLPLDSEWTLPSLGSPPMNLRGCLERLFPGLSNGPWVLDSPMEALRLGCDDIKFALGHAEE